MNRGVLTPTNKKEIISIKAKGHSKSKESFALSNVLKQIRSSSHNTVKEQRPDSKNSTNSKTIVNRSRSKNKASSILSKPQGGIVGLAVHKVNSNNYKTINVINKKSESSTDKTLNNSGSAQLIKTKKNATNSCNTTGSSSTGNNNNYISVQSKIVKQK